MKLFLLTLVGSLANSASAARIFCLAFALMATNPARAATVTAIDTGSSATLIFIDGEIAEGDHQQFIAATQNVQYGAVLLRSDGGDLIDGLEIGRTIRSRGYSTGVAPNFACASACGLIWLAGVQRYMSSSSLVGFHAAYIATDNGLRETGVGNALVGAYLTELGLPIEAVIFSTIAGPNEINWLTIDAAQRVGIDVQLLEVGKTPDINSTGFSPSPTPLQLPSGFRWIVLSSSSDPDNLPLERYQSSFGRNALTVVDTSTGYYALALGPFSEADAEDSAAALKSMGEIPADAYLSSGNGFTVRLN